MRKKILVVDDSKANIDILIDILDEYDVLVALNGKKAIEIVNKKDIDLILLDIVMPELDGYQTCKIIKQNPNTKHIPIIFITAKTDRDSIAKAYDVGGIDYIKKPFYSIEVLSRVHTQLSLSDYTHKLEDLVDKKTKEIQDINQEIEDTQKEVIFLMGSIGETRSKETGNHVKRVAQYTKILALGLGMDEDEAEMMKMASPMHDIGKVGIPDSILNKPAKLTPQEFEIMKQHAQIGYDMLKYSKRPILQTAAIIAYQHHEKYDGTGYPQGLKGEDIHIYGRITAVADVFDALGSDRVYKKAWDDEKIFKLLKDEKSKHFDPKIIDIFFENLDEILEVRDRLKETYPKNHI